MGLTSAVSILLLALRALHGLQFAGRNLLGFIFGAAVTGKVNSCSSNRTKNVHMPILSRLLGSFTACIFWNKRFNFDFKVELNSLTRGAWNQWSECMPLPVWLGKAIQIIKRPPCNDMCPNYWSQGPLIYLFSSTLKVTLYMPFRAGEKPKKCCSTMMPPGGCLGTSFGAFS